MNNQKIISIIIPIYNAESFLRDCINSVLNQTYKNLDIILINDGSEDNSDAIVREFLQDARIRYICQENSGVSVARNRGIDMATGQYLMFVDADDTITCDCCETLLEAALRNDADMVIGKSVSKSIDVQYDGSEVYWTGDRALKECLLDNPHMYTVWAKLYKREFAGDTRQCGRVHEDIYYNFLVSLKDPVVVIVNQGIYCYKPSVGSSRNAPFSNKYLDIMDIADRICQKTVEIYPIYKDLAENYKIKSAMSLLGILALRTRNEQKVLEKELIHYVQRNAKYYIPTIKRDNLWFFVLKYNLYGIYKFIRRL